MSETIVKIGIIGLGARAETLLASLFQLPGVEVAAVCDIDPERVARIESIFDRNGLPKPKAYSEYRALLDAPEVEAVFVPTSWNSHLAIAREALKRGKYVGIEVGGASSVEELWRLVHAAEETGTPCMI